VIGDYSFEEPGCEGKEVTMVLQKILRAEFRDKP
jgi:hypothetical protein